MLVAAIPGPFSFPVQLVVALEAGHGRPAGPGRSGMPLETKHRLHCGALSQSRLWLWPELFESADRDLLILDDLVRRLAFPRQ